jgi:beta-glucanase (GH16 family)
MKARMTILIGVIALLSSPVLATPTGEQDWSMVWSDEFDGDKIDRAKWGFDIDCWGGGNEEHQCYTKSARNAAIEDGKLVTRLHQTLKLFEK